jgi:formiminoglutamase
VAEFWQGDAAAVRSGRAVLIGFPQDEGVRRNHGRPGAAAAPDEIRRWLYRLTPWDAETEADLTQMPPLDLGNIRIAGSLEESQRSLAQVVAAILERGAVPLVLGGGHETAYGHFLGYVAANRRVGIINIDAHLDVRPLLHGQGHSGSPFRQALEHPNRPLYVCLGAEPQATSRQHLRYAQEHGAVVRWRTQLHPSLAHHLAGAQDHLATAGCAVYVTIDADVVHMSDVPGVSAPNPAGLPGEEVLAATRLAGRSPQVASLDLVEINPAFDRDGQSARWGALLVWNFLVGMSLRLATAQE